MRCANTEAANKYLDEQDRAAVKYESMIQALMDEIEIDYNDLHSRFDRIVKDYGFPLSFEEFVSENL